MRADSALAKGLATHAGSLTSVPVARAHGYPAARLTEVLGGHPSADSG